MPKKTHIQKLFDQINGGDDVDAAEEAQEIAEDLYKSLVEVNQAFFDFCEDRKLDKESVAWIIIDDADKSIHKAEGRHP